MSMHKFWRELYLTLMVTAALVVILTAVIFFSDLSGLVVTAGGVFIAVLGVGFYDQWHDAELAKARVKTRR